MVYRGCILKIEKDFAVVVTNTMEYFKIVKKEGLSVGSEIIFVKEDLYHEKKGYIRNTKVMAAVLLVMVLSVALLGRFNLSNYISNGAVAIVSVDINPSIEFEIDGTKKVVKVLPLNEDGEALIDKEMVGMDVDQAISIVVKNGINNQYITIEKNSVLISTVVIKDEKINRESIEKTIKDGMTLHGDEDSLNIVYIGGNKEDLKDARKANVSIGKYEVFKESEKSDKKITLEEIKGMKVQEMVDKKVLKIEEKEEKKIRIEKKKEEKKSLKIQKEKEISQENKGEISQETVEKKKEKPVMEQEKKNIKDDKDNKDDNDKKNQQKKGIEKDHEKEKGSKKDKD